MNAMMLKVYRIRPDRSIEEKGKGRKEKKIQQQQQKEKNSKKDINRETECTPNRIAIADWIAGAS